MEKEEQEKVEISSLVNKKLEATATAGEQVISFCLAEQYRDSGYVFYSDCRLMY